MNEDNIDTDDVDQDSESTEREQTVREYKEMIEDLNQKRDQLQAQLDESSEGKIDSNSAALAASRRKTEQKLELYSLDQLMGETTVLSEDDVAYEQQRLTDLEQLPATTGRAEDMVSPNLIVQNSVPGSLENAVRDKVGDRLGTLVVSLQGRHQVKYPLYSGEITIGRLKQNDIQINSQFVSRSHARIVTDIAGVAIEDLSSKNGVVVDAKPVLRHVFRNGDTATLGTTLITYFTSNDVDT